MIRSSILSLAALLLAAPPARAGDHTKGEEDWRFDLGLIFSHFEQQVKTEIGGESGDLILQDTEFGLNLFATYRVWGPFSLGIYMEYDVGRRTAAGFAGFDSNGAATTSGELGGTFHEFWIGPMFRIQWRTFFAELAWGAFGIRKDEGRTDLPSKGGSTDASLLTSPAVAWLVALGGGIPVLDTLEVVIRLEYRVRYYNRRTDADFAGGLVHGTQSWAPFIGVAYKIF